MRLLLAGCGKMGGAILQRVSGDSTACVVDPAPAPPHFKSHAKITWLHKPDEIEAGFQPDIVILAMKPQHMAEAVPAYAKFRQSVFLSIAAGMPIARINSFLKDGGHAIVRSMPNLPASIGEGMSVAVANSHVTPQQRDLCGRILEAVGKKFWVEDESLLDAVTALSGNGPAYVFALCEAMAKAGEALGLPPDMANELARQTVIGSGALLAQSDQSAEKLRIAVTSPGGTTEAALKQLLAAGGLHDLMLKAMKDAAARAKELAKLA